MIASGKISLQSNGHCDIIDITAEVREQVAKAGIKDGSATVFVTGSTAGVTTVEFEPGLVADLKAVWQRLVPENIGYEHDCRWGDGNGYSHVRAALLGASLTIPVADGELCLGTWQQIVAIDFDSRPRRREIIIQVSGE